MELLVGGRNSPLSQRQIQEVLKEIQVFHPQVKFQPILLETIGDKDQITSLRDLEKTDFFTKEIDQLLLKRECHIAIHSAKDLPDPLPNGISIIAITEGIDSSDSLVFREGENLERLPPNAIIATSSLRREEAVKILRSDLVFQDIRGTIDQRLQKLYDGRVDGVVIAEAAIMRLGLQKLNRIKVPGETVALQGKLAITACGNDNEMAALFSCLDTRKNRTSLYLGLDLPFSGFEDRRLIHKPIIAIQPAPLKTLKVDFCDIAEYTHIIFTSKTAVRLFFQTFSELKLSKDHLSNKTYIAVGKATQHAIENQGLTVQIVAEEETSEGVIKELYQLEKSACIFWPHSSGSRHVIAQFLQSNNYRFKECILYSTIPSETFTMPNLSLFDEIIFTSPSTVDTFYKHGPKFQEPKYLTAIGPITESYLAKYR